jgi:hypothetical protein
MLVRIDLKEDDAISIFDGEQKYVGTHVVQMQMLDALRFKQRILVNLQSTTGKASVERATILNAFGDLFQIVEKPRLVSHALSVVSKIRGAKNLFGLSLETLTPEPLFGMISHAAPRASTQPSPWLG